MTKVRLCDGCPILNNDYESGHDCNLGYSTSYERIRDNYWGVVNISGDCKLERIVIEGKTIIPDSIDIDGGLALSGEKSKPTFIIELKNITEEQPGLYEEVLIVNRGKNDFNKAAYMRWNEGTSDECYNWYDEHDRGYEFEEWPFWARPISY